MYSVTLLSKFMTNIISFCIHKMIILQTYPAARIAGRGFKWTTDEPGNQGIPQGKSND